MSSKKIFNSSFFLLLILSIGISCKKKNKPVQINILNHIASDAKIQLIDINDAQYTVLDTTSLRNKKASISTYISKGLFNLQIENKNYFLYLQPGDNVQINIKENDYTIKNSPDSDSLRKLISRNEIFIQKIIALDTQIVKAKKTEIDSLNKLKEFINENYFNQLEIFCTQQKTAEVSCFAFNFFGDHKASIPFMLEEIKKRYKQNSDSKYVSQWQSALQSYQEQALQSSQYGLSNGVTAPNIIAQNTEGDTIELYDLRGKFVLLDFWASWCQPCRKKNPEIVALYKKMKSKNFEIFSISLDSKVELWKKAIKTDKLNWPNHASDLLGWNSTIASTYRVEAIPCSYLIAPNGKIIAKDIDNDSIVNLINNYK
jgi:peroxiredoxin